MKLTSEFASDFYVDRNRFSSTGECSSEEELSDLATHVKIFQRASDLRREISGR